MKLSKIKKAKYNPRKISDKALSGLKESLKSFGDISGIVINKKTGNLVAGHQRVKALQDQYGDLEIKNGVIEAPDGNSYKIRYVDWPIEKEKQANIAANNPHIAGNWTEDLSDILGELKGIDEDFFEKLNYDDLWNDIPEIVITGEENNIQEPTTDDDWISFKIGDIKGQLFIDVYKMFESEWERLQGIVDSEKITPVFEAMIINSANTPEESLK